MKNYKAYLVSIMMYKYQSVLNRYVRVPGQTYRNS